MGKYVQKLLSSFLGFDDVSDDDIGLDIVVCLCCISGGDCCGCACGCDSVLMIVRLTASATR